MIVITGTKRSGTSAWMQILRAGGITVIGEDFPRSWGMSIREANPRGFLESRLRVGVNFANNPHPETGAYLHPTETRLHAVKVFIPGLVRTDHAFLHRVLVTIRPWREYTLSLERLHTMEDAFLATRPLHPDETEEQRAEANTRLRNKRSELPAPVEWWLELYEVIRDIAVRRYPVHLVTYDRLLSDPEAEVSRAFQWMGLGDVAAGVAAVEPGLRSQSAPELPLPEGLFAEEVALFDEVYEALHRHRRLPRSLVDRMNQSWGEIEPRFRGKSRRDDQSAEAPSSE